MHVETLIFILTAGILESTWCLKELRTAIKCKKQVNEMNYKVNDIQIGEMA